MPNVVFSWRRRLELDLNINGFGLAIRKHQFHQITLDGTPVLRYEFPMSEEELLRVDAEDTE